MQEKITPAQFKTTILNKINRRIDNLFKEIIGYMHSYLEGCDPTFEELEKKMFEYLSEEERWILEKVGEKFKKDGWKDYHVEQIFNIEADGKQTPVGYKLILFF